MSTYTSAEYIVWHIDYDLYIEENLLISVHRSIQTTDGNTTQTVAGSALSSGYLEGVGEAARFQEITGFIQISNRDVVIVDSGNHCFRILDRLTLNTEPFIGACGTPGNVDGVLSRFNRPRSVIVDNQNKEKLLVTDQTNKAIRHVNMTGASAATFFTFTGQFSLRGITQDSENGNLYLTSANAVYQLTYHDKTVTIIAGSPTQYGHQDGTFLDSRFSSPNELLLIDNNRKLLVADTNSHRLRVLDRVSNTTESICNGAVAYTDGDISSCSLFSPQSLFVLGDSLYIGEHASIRKLSGSFSRIPHFLAECHRKLCLSNNNWLVY